MKYPKMTYQYFLLGEDVPVRVTFNEQGRKMGAEIPSREKGALVYNHAFLRKVYNGDVSNFDEVREITEEEFTEKVQACLGASVG